MSLVEVLYLPIQPFVWNPLACFAVAGGFGVFWLLLRGKHSTQSIAVAALAWTLFGFWKSYAHRTGANIRVDLLVLAPVIYIITILGIMRTVREFRKRV